MKFRTGLHNEVKLQFGTPLKCFDFDNNYYNIIVIM